MLALLRMYVIIGVLFVLISVPLIRRSVPPNRWYGFRVRQTLENPEIWYAVNAHMGRRMIWVGILLAVTAMACYVVPGMTKDVYAWIILAVLVVSLAFVVASSVRYMLSLGRR